MDKTITKFEILNHKRQQIKISETSKKHESEFLYIRFFCFTLPA